MISKITVEVEVKQKEISLIIEEEVKTIRLEGDEDNGMVMTLITVIGIIGTGTVKVRTMLIEAEDGTVTDRKETVIGEGGDIGILIPIINNRDTHNNPNTLIPITAIPHQWAININIRCLMNSTPRTRSNNSNTHHKDCRHNHTKL